MRERHDVAVVGAGPAGSWAARRLAERGNDVVLVERSAGPRPGIVCTGLLGTEAFGAFDLPRRAVVDEVRRARFVSPGGVEVVYQNGGPLARVVDRMRFDASLAGSARGAGAQLLRGWTVRGVRRVGGGVELSLTASGGRQVAQLRARALVVATGYRKTLHRAAGLGRPAGVVLGAHADLPFPPLGEAELYFGSALAPGFFAWAVPFGGGLARLGVLGRRDVRGLLRRFLRSAAIRDRLAAAGISEAEAARRIRTRAIVQGPVRPSAADRVVAVGEAAGQVKTTTAGGIYYGLLGAEMAAEILDDGLRRDRLDAGWLGRYERRWWGELGPEIRAGLRLQIAARAMPDGEVDRLFASVRRGLAPALREVVRFDWHRPALEILFRRSALRRFLMRPFAAGRCA